jgi:hypothetical protein
MEAVPPPSLFDSTSERAWNMAPSHAFMSLVSHSSSASEFLMKDTFKVWRAAMALTFPLKVRVSHRLKSDLNTLYSSPGLPANLGKGSLLDGPPKSSWCLAILLVGTVLSRAYSRSEE